MKMVKTVIVPIAALTLLAYLGKYIYIVDGQLDILRASRDPVKVCVIDVI